MCTPANRLSHIVSHRRENGVRNTTLIKYTEILLYIHPNGLCSIQLHLVLRITASTSSNVPPLSFIAFFLLSKTFN